VLKPSLTRERQVHLYGLIYRARHSAYSQQTFFIWRQFKSFYLGSCHIVDRKAYVVVEVGQGQFVLPEREQYVFDVVRPANSLECDISFNNCAFTSTAIADDKTEIRSGKGDTPSLGVGVKQVIFLGHERNVAYDEARAMISYIGLSKNFELPRDEQQKQEIQASET